MPEKEIEVEKINKILLCYPQYLSGFKVIYKITIKEKIQK